MNKTFNEKLTPEEKSLEKILIWNTFMYTLLNCSYWWKVIVWKVVDLQTTETFSFQKGKIQMVETAQISKKRNTRWTILKWVFEKKLLHCHDIICGSNRCSTDYCSGSHWPSSGLYPRFALSWFFMKVKRYFFTRKKVFL